jgi:hypothetical protein|tara:strand:+ start:3580 stop:6753 length:3174 start_codon:yes stop_codon:yes gene_type:complete
MNADDVYEELLLAQSGSPAAMSSSLPAPLIVDPVGAVDKKPDLSPGQGPSVNSATLPSPAPPIAGAGPGGSDLEWFQPGYSQSTSDSVAGVGALGSAGLGYGSGTDKEEVSVAQDILSGAASGMIRAGRDATGALAMIIGAPADATYSLLESFGFDVGDPAFGSENIEENINSLSSWVVRNIPGLSDLDQDFTAFAGEKASIEWVKTLAEGITRFGTGAVTGPVQAVRLLGVANPVVRGMAWGALTDFIQGGGSAKTEQTMLGTIPSMIEGLDALSPKGPERKEWADTIFNVFRKTENDSGFMRRAKSALDGFVLGGAAEGVIFLAIKAVKAVPWGTLNAGARQAVQRAKQLPVGLSTKDVGDPTMREMISGEGARVSATNILRRSRTHGDLEGTFPPEVRVASGEPTAGPKTLPDGREYSSLPLEKAGGGATFSQIDLDSTWDDAVEAAGPQGRELITKLAADGKTFEPRGIGFWDDALKLPDRARYWYEISAEAFRDVLPHLNPDEMKQFIDLVAATSAQADPHQNIRRALMSLSQHRRGVPMDTPLTHLTPVRTALSGESLPGLKTGNFSGTFQYHLGLDNSPPLSTNDRQVAASFGIDGDDIAGNQVAYEVLSDFYIRLRDRLNAKLPADAAPYETWQLQALGWVQQRTDLGNARNDDYVQALGKVMDDLREAGVNVPGGKLTDEVLLDPRLEEVLAPTLDRFRQSSIATVETVTSQSAVGARVAGLLRSARERGDTIAVREHDKIVNTSIDDLIRRKKELGNKSVAEVVYKAVTGKAGGLSRMEKGFGTFGGELSKNARIPLPPDMSEPERQAFLSLLGRGLRQDAMAASVFRIANHGDPVPEGMTQTYSAFIKSIDADISEDALRAVADALPEGFEINVKRVPNGTVVDINPSFGSGGPVGITEDALADALEAAGIDLDSVVSYSRHHTSDFLEKPEYVGSVAQLRRTVLNDEATKIKDVFDGKLATARAYLRGSGGEEALTAGKRKRVQAAFRRYQRRVGDLTQADTQTRGVNRRTLEAFSNYDKRFGPRLSTAEKDGMPRNMTGSVNGN